MGRHELSAVEELFGEDADPVAAVVDALERELAAPPKAPDPPRDNPRGLTIFDCGHSSFGSDAEHAAARAEGHCCAGGKVGRAVHWWAVEGIRVPAKERRSLAKERAGGYPGLCCDDSGLYIGGIGNDCRYYGPASGARCAVHRPAAPAAAPNFGGDGAHDPLEEPGDAGTDAAAAARPTRRRRRKE